MSRRFVCILVLSSIIQTGLPAGNPTQPVRQDEAAAVLKAVPFPNPNPISLRIQLYKDAPAVCARVFKSDGSFFFEQCLGPQAEGWTELILGAEWREAPAGRYFFKVDAGGQHDADKAGVMVKQR